MRGINPEFSEAGLQVAYRSELMAFDKAGLHLFLPSRAMARHVPHVDPARMSALPPGRPTSSPVARAAMAATAVTMAGTSSCSSWACFRTTIGWTPASRL